ncbi:hypothetical protein ABPG77_001991 [Micractinium sp. CCAP 211/92]
MRSSRAATAASAALLLLALATSRATAQGAAQYFLQLDSVPGDSTDARFPGAIVLLGYTVGGDAPRSDGGAIKVTKYLDRASPQLWLANLTGKHFKSATVTARKTGPSGFVFATVALTDVTITGYQVSLNQQGQSEQATVTGARVQFCERFQKADGSLGGSVCGCWDYKSKITSCSSAPP